MHQYNLLFESLIFISKPLYLVSETTPARCACWWHWMGCVWMPKLYIYGMRPLGGGKSTQSPWVHWGYQGVDMSDISIKIVYGSLLGFFLLDENFTLDLSKRSVWLYVETCLVFCNHTIKKENILSMPQCTYSTRALFDGSPCMTAEPFDILNLHNVPVPERSPRNFKQRWISMIGGWTSISEGNAVRRTMTSKVPDLVN